MGRKEYLRLIFILWGIALLLPCCAAFGQQYRTVEESSPQEVVDGMASKAVRGVANVATGWIELPKQIYITYREDGFARGVFVGPWKGVGMTLARTMTGVGELVTFFAPFPGFYDPYFEPEYVWGKE